MPLSATTPRSLVDQAIDGMRALLADGEWSVGTRIPPEPVLAAELGVSRNTVREAVRALAHGGVLEVRRGDGTYVAAPNEVSALIRREVGRVELGHVLEVRHAIESRAASLAARRRTEEDLGVLADALRRRRSGAADRDAERFVTADCDFHLAVVAAAHNPLLSELYEGFLETLMASVVLPPDGADDLAPAHDGLLTAIAAGDPEAASAASTALLEQVGH